MVVSQDQPILSLRTVKAKLARKQNVNVNNCVWLVLFTISVHPVIYC
jgi:hypothetical protein